MTDIVLDLADRVSAHMTAVFPYTGYAGGWIVARDRRDRTAVVVWRQGDEPVQPRVRGMALYRWLCSLRDAGFTGQARTDMGVFGQPDDESPDGVARWLHITAWSQPAVPVLAPLRPRPVPPPQVCVPMPPGRRLVCPLSGVPVSELVFTYRPDGSVETVLHYQAGALDWGALEPRPPVWLVELAEQYRPTGGESS